MTSPAPLNVVISGGGTAGHIYPALAVAHALQAGRPSAAGAGA
ncbi:MAG TPA: glycosyltransferase, partial [Chloroflexota bacterium]|nr:glycosyltransferase [Chloroflexota bacterium]